jgi:hypothetical protein
MMKGGGGEAEALGTGCPAYAQARDLIRTGDLIVLRKRGGWLPTLTRWVTKSPYTHTGLAVSRRHSSRTAIELWPTRRRSRRGRTRRPRGQPHRQREG